MIKLQRDDRGHPDKLRYILSEFNGQLVVDLRETCYVKIGKEWYDMEKPAGEVHFPVTLKENNILKILSKIDET